MPLDEQLGGLRPALLELIGVSKAYPSAASTAAAATVLKDISLRVAAGESLAVTGPSGCGKSTLLNLMAALDRPTTGRVLLGGQDLSNLGDASLAEVRNRRIGLVFQLHHLLPQCTVLENVLLPTLAQRHRDSQAAARAEHLLDRVGLADHRNHRPGQLSGGQQQRVAVVRAMINQPALLLADEPTGSLDRAAAENLADLLVQLNRDEHVSLIVVTHWPELARAMRRTLELRDGRLHTDSEA